MVVQPPDLGCRTLILSLLFVPQLMNKEQIKNEYGIRNQLQPPVGRSTPSLRLSFLAAVSSSQC